MAANYQVAIFRSSAAVGPPTTDEYPEEDDNGHFAGRRRHNVEQKALCRRSAEIELVGKLDASQSVKNQLNETL